MVALTLSQIRAIKQFLLIEKATEYNVWEGIDLLESISVAETVRVLAHFNSIGLLINKIKGFVANNKTEEIQVGSYETVQDRLHNEYEGDVVLMMFHEKSKDWIRHRLVSAPYFDKLLIDKCLLDILCEQASNNILPGLKEKSAIRYDAKSNEQTVKSNE